MLKKVSKLLRTTSKSERCLVRSLFVRPALVSRATSCSDSPLKSSACSGGVVIIQTNTFLHNCLDSESD